MPSRFLAWLSCVLPLAVVVGGCSDRSPKEGATQPQADTFEGPPGSGDFVWNCANVACVVNFAAGEPAPHNLGLLPDYIDGLVSYSTCEGPSQPDLAFRDHEIPCENAFGLPAGIGFGGGCTATLERCNPSIRSTRRAAPS